MRRPTKPGRPCAEAGFTLIELLVVMGILSGFLVMLVQLVDSGLRMFGEGELGQQFADRTSHAQRVIAAELQALRGSSTGRDRDKLGDRLVVQLLPIGLPPRAEQNATRVQVLRASIHLPVDRELALLPAFLAAQMHRESHNVDASVDAKVAEKMLVEPLRGIGNLLLVPWRQLGADDAILELRAGWFLPGQMVPNGPDRWVDPFEIPVPGGPDLPGLLVYSITTPLLQNLLHVEFLLWAQQTKSWGGEGESGGLGPERIWDSARGGWLVDAPSGGVFALDRGIRSLGDTTDDIQPHAILVRCVVALPPE
ncbi:MAG TPA: type II secretion system protein, partial [Planctomycetota bacterium]|nr:type II secretion system protein [Planctomycetota bacterium]